MILDLNSTPITAVNLFVEPNDEKLFSALIDCGSGYGLDAEAFNQDDTPNADVGVFAKASPGDSWTDILSTPLDLTAFAPDRKQIYFRITAANGATLGDSIVLIHRRRQ